MAKIDIDKTIPFFVDYFHAISLQDEATDIFTTSAGSVMITPSDAFDPLDVTAKVINPLKEQGFLKVDGERLLVPLEGFLEVPDVATTTGFPLVIIAHGQFAGHFVVEKTDPVGTTKGHYTFKKVQEHDPSFPQEEVSSYLGYRDLQGELSKNGIASFSINLNIVNDLDTKFATQLGNLFEKQAVDFSQRILLTFLHLKLLRVLAGVTGPTAGDDMPIRFFTGTTFEDLTTVLANPTLDPRLQPLRDALVGSDLAGNQFSRIDFNKLGFMGHSRGADAVSRLPAYFFAGATAQDPTFPVNSTVNDRIKALALQIGQPQREVIKCILALEPTATENESDAKKHGYVIDNNQTMYFVVVGTHDEDVSMDPVRIYEFPECPKVMIAINGATHKRFNSEWANPDNKKFEDLKVTALSKEQHSKILTTLVGSCFTGTLGGQPSHLLRFTKKTKFVIDLPKGIDDFQGAWNFGFPFTSNTPINLDDKVTSPSQQNIQGEGYDFEQELEAFFVEKINEGTFTIRIPIDPNTGQRLSNFNHFSFRFAKGFDVSDGTRVEEKNFKIQFFENDTPVGKPIAGSDIETLKLQAFQAFDRRENTPDPVVEYSILMQTAELTLAEHLSATELPRITRIDINIIPDVTKSPPRSTADVAFGTIGGVILGGGVGVGGATLWNLKFDPDEDKRDRNLIIGGIAGAVVFGVRAFIILKADKHAFVFKDFLLTNRQIPASATP